MPLYTYTIEQAEEWDKVVRSFTFYDIYYLSGYVKAFQIHGDGQPLLFYYTDGEFKGINVVMKRDIADDEFFAEKIGRDKVFDFITPYGYGGWLFEGEGEKTQLFMEYETWCRQHCIVSEFVRYHPMLNNAEASNDFYDIVKLGKTISMDLSSEDIIWANLTSKNRNMIRKAQKSGVEICHGQLPEMYNIFKEIYNLTMDFDNAKAYYYFEDEFYDSIRRELLSESQIFLAKADGKVIAASIVLFTNGYINYHLSGSLREYRNLAPSNLLLYKIALWGCQNGYKTLHMGGGVGSKEDSLYKFKSAFNRNKTEQFVIGKKVYLSDIYDKLVQMKKINEESDFFPKYRACADKTVSNQRRKG